jgi:hypothetical protein
MSKKVLISFLLDRSGSMGSYKKQTIDSFNEYVNGLQDDDTEMVFRLTTFDSESVDVVHDNVPVEDVPKLNDDTYQPRSMTPLYDAVAKTILATDKIVDKGGFGKKKQRVLFVILTDGYENASHEYTKEGAFDLVKSREKRGWTSVYLGANQDAYAVGVGLGIQAGNAVNFDMGKIGVVARSLSSASVNYARSGAVATADFFVEEDVSSYTEDPDKNARSSG